MAKEAAFITEGFESDGRNKTNHLSAALMERCVESRMARGGGA
jgi:hypothetical protein